MNKRKKKVLKLLCVCAACAIQLILLESITLLKSGICILLRCLLRNISVDKERNEFLASKTFESVELALSCSTLR